MRISLSGVQEMYVLYKTLDIVKEDIRKIIYTNVL